MTTWRFATIIITFVISNGYCEEPPEDFDFSGAAVKILQEPIDGNLASDSLIVVSVLDNPLSPQNVDGWLLEEEGFGELKSYTESHARFLADGFSDTGTAYMHWKSALLKQFSRANVFSNSGRANYAVYVIVRDVRIPAKKPDISKVRVIANYRLVNLDNHMELFESEVNTVGEGPEATWKSSKAKADAAALNSAVRENIRTFIDRLRIVGQNLQGQ